jgi:hypothetical protein
VYFNVLCYCLCILWVPKIFNCVRHTIEPYVRILNIMMPQDQMPNRLHKNVIIIHSFSLKRVLDSMTYLRNKSDIVVHVNMFTILLQDGSYSNRKSGTIG